MTKDYKDFLDWATPQLTLNQYRKLARIIHSFKKYNLITGQATSTLCQFKDDQVYAYTNFPKFFAEMAELAEQNIENFFNKWYYDNVIFWPYEETPELVEARERLMKKCENHITPYRYLYIFRENEHGEIANLVVVNKCFSGSPLLEYSLDKWINIMWRKHYSSELDLDNYPVSYNIEHNTKVIVKAFTGISNKEYKEYLPKVRFSEWSEDKRSKVISEHTGKMLFGDLNEISKYKFDSAILYNMFSFIHKYKRNITLYGQPYHVAGHNKVITYLMCVIKDLANEGKLKEDK